MADSVRVQVTGLRELRKDLRRLDKAANREIGKALKKGLEPLLADARGMAPRESGQLAASLKVFVSGNRAGIRSRLPYASVQHWGGRIYPRGGEVRIRRTEFVTRAVVPREDRLVDDVGDAIETAARHNGWH